MVVVQNQGVGDHRQGPLLFLQVLSLILAGMLVITVPCLILSLGVEKALLWGVGLGSMLILLVPVFIRNEHDIFEPISFVMLFTTMGVTLRTLYLLLYYRSNNESIAFLLRGEAPEFLLASGVLILSGLFSFLLGYMIKPIPFQVDRFSIIRRHEWSIKRLFLTIFVMEVIAAIATYLFVKEMGIQSLALYEISSKHFQAIEGASFAKSSLGLYRWPASWTEISFYLGMTWFATSGRKWFSIAGGGVIVLGVLAFIFPFMNSSRSSVVFIIINGLVISHYLRKEISVKKIGYAALAIVVILLVMIALRKNVNEFDSISGYLVFEKVLDVLVGSGKFMDISKPAHIMAAIPTKIDYEYGTTMMQWVLAPIPRSLWLTKPPILCSTTIGQYVYGTMDPSGMGASIPPGLIAELFWNFHLMGVIVGLFVLGAWLKFLYNNFKRHLYSNRNAVLIYLLLMSPCIETLQNSFGQFVVEAVKAIIPMLISLLFIGKPVKAE